MEKQLTQPVETVGDFGRTQWSPDSRSDSVRSRTNLPQTSSKYSGDVAAERSSGFQSSSYYSPSRQQEKDEMRAHSSVSSSYVGTARGVGNYDDNIRASPSWLSNSSDDKAPLLNRLETCLLTHQIGNFPISSIRYRRNVTAGVHKFSKNPGVTSKFSCHKSDTKQVPHWGLTVLESPVNLTVIGCFLLGACELIHIFVCEEKDWNNGTVNMRHNHTKFSCLGNIVPGICVPLSYWYLILLIRYKSDIVL